VGCLAQKWGRSRQKHQTFSVNSSNDKHQYWRGTTSKYYSNHQNMNMLLTALLESGELGFLLITKKLYSSYRSVDTMLVMPLVQYIY